MKVSGVYTGRNEVSVGYPFIGAIRSVLPMVDEMLVNDGGSDDGSLELKEWLADNSDTPIDIFHIEDFESDLWECIDEQLEQLIDTADGDWIIESQADEIWGEWGRNRTLAAMSAAHEWGYNSLRQPRVHTTGYDYMYWTVRVVRNLDDLRSIEGGDSFYVGDERTINPHYTTHDVPPELPIDVPFFHQKQTINILEHRNRHADWLATKSESREEQRQRLLDRL